MKFSNLHIFACAGLLCLTIAPVSAHNTLAGAGVLADVDATPPASNTPLAPSVTAHLQMQAGQIERLSRLFDVYAARRFQQEASIAQRQNQLTAIQATTPFDQAQAGRLRRAISEAQQQVTTDFLATHVKALKMLMTVQRAQLEALANDTRLKVRHDKYYELLLLPTEQLWQSPLPTERNRGELERNGLPSRPRQQAHHNGSANYGVYGGYGQGEPQYGVYGNYGKGRTGVQVGIGRGGPSVGIGIGGIFGGWHRR